MREGYGNWSDENRKAWSNFSDTNVFQTVLKTIQEARDKKAIADAIDLLKANGYKVFKAETTVTLTEV